MEKFYHLQILKARRKKQGCPLLLGQPPERKKKIQTSMFAFFSLKSGVLPPRRCGATEGHTHPALLIVLHHSKPNSPHTKPERYITR
jgi:hypothetical protein